MLQGVRKGSLSHPCLEKDHSFVSQGCPFLPFLFTCLGKVQRVNVTDYLWVPAELKARASRKCQVEHEEYVRVLALLQVERVDVPEGAEDAYCMHGLAILQHLTAFLSCPVGVVVNVTESLLLSL